jgi:hypothetical protein
VTLCPNDPDIPAGDEHTENLGWRRVDTIQYRKRGVGWVVYFSADLKPEL